MNRIKQNMPGTLNPPPSPALVFLSVVLVDCQELRGKDEG